MPGFVVSEQQQIMCKAAFWGAITAAVHERILPGERASIPGRRLRAGLVGHGRRLRVGQAVHGGQLRARRPGEREAPAAHTLTEALLPTTCVVVNKPPALQHFPTIGLRPTVRKSFTRTAKSPQEPPAPRTASRIHGIAASTRQKSARSSGRPLPASSPGRRVASFAISRSRG